MMNLFEFLLLNFIKNLFGVISIAMNEENLVKILLVKFFPRNQKPLLVSN